MEFFTIGVYNSTEQGFFRKLTENSIDTFCDIRQRRGVRGSQYAFVNSNRLQHRLNELGVNYLHVLELAPTPEVRELQKEADKAGKVEKRVRSVLGKVFAVAFKDRVLRHFDFDSFLQELNALNAKRIVLFCVEEKPEACHRSIVGERLEALGFKTLHL